MWDRWDIFGRLRDDDANENSIAVAVYQRRIATGCFGCKLQPKPATGEGTLSAAVGASSLHCGARSVCFVTSSVAFASESEVQMCVCFLFHRHVLVRRRWVVWLSGWSWGPSDRLSLQILKFRKLWIFSERFSEDSPEDSPEVNNPVRAISTLCFSWCSM